MKSRLYTMKLIYQAIFTLILSACLQGQGSYDIVLKAKALIERGKPGEAITILDNAAQSAKESRLLLLRAEAYLQLGNTQAAMSDYLEAGRIDPSSGDYGLSRIFALRGDAKGSLEHLERNLQSRYRKSEKEVMLDPAFEKIENTPDWRQFWKTERYSVPETTLQEIEFLIKSGKTGDAVRLAEELNGRFPSDQKTIYARALAEYTAGRYDEALAGINEILANDRNNISALNLMAAMQISSSNYVGASATYSRLIGLETADVSLFLKRAECYRKTGEYNRAEADAGKYLELFPESRQALSLAGRIAAASGDNFKAMNYFSQNLKLNPGDAGCYIERANAYFMSGSWNNAISDYSMALDISPDSPDVWLNKGISLLNSGNTDDACFDFGKALELGNKKAASYISRYCIR
jgi:tetratricopeptide (TPR) repeat protein